MSWVHHHKPSTSSTNNTSSLLTSSSSLSSLAKTANPCSTAQQNFNINASTMPTSPMAAANVAQKQVLPPPTRPPFSSSSSASSLTATSVLRSQATSNNSSLLMTSQQYPNKTNLHTTTNSTMPSMRLSNTSNAPYTLAQQPQQQQRQQYIPPTATPQYGTPNNNTSTTNNHLVQGPFNNNQQNSWQAHSVTSQNYLPTSKMMPQMQPPLSTVGATNAGANNNWQSGQQNYQSSNMMYQQHAGGVAPQQHQQHQQQQWPQQNSAVNQQMYDNSFNHQQQQVSNNAYQQQQQQQQQAAAASYFQQAAAPQPQQQQQPLQTSLTNMSQTTTTNAVNFFDNANNNNNNNQSTGDGWGDWDWNDNSTIEANESAIQHQQQQQQQQISTQMHHPPQSQQQTQPPPPTAVAAPPPLPAVANDHNQAFNSSNIIADSFNQQSNDTWNWNATNAAVENVPAHVENKTALAKVEQQHNDNWNWTTTNEEDTQPQQQQQQQQTVVTNDHASNDNWNWSSNETNQQQIAQTTSTVQDIKQAVQPASKSVEAAAIMPLAPPPTEFSSSAVSENHNYNTNAAPQTSTSTNIPNTVFVSQAKPVTLPSRQYASPPMGNTPVSENPPTEGTALMPPQAFQNAEEAAVSRPTNLQSPALPPPTTAVPPPAGLPPAATAAAAGNPFKRSGLAQHHRATALMPTMPQASPAVFNMPPPPPADFANPLSSSNVTLLEPENNEIPSQENQEILAPHAAIMQPSLQPPTSTISLPNAATVAQPPNDERNQYLQTSHLSENSEDQQPEADGLLPPPGLSRLVLGEPELEASQRMVMGTDAPVLGNNATVADVMHLEERHADGEDTASENAVPVISSAMGGVGGQVSPPSTSDRNLYLVPGESNVNNQQRVVTGVELQEQREIEMDGENLEDQQQQQQQQQQNHHQQQPQQQQHHNHHQPSPQTHQTLSPEARNEPPVEGAADIIEPSVPAPSVSQPLEQASDAHHHPHQPSKTKESHNNISSPNDDDDSDERLLNERAMDHSTAGSSKSRTKYDNERYGGRVRRSLNRYAAYASDEYVNSDGDGDYSSDREERERRERNDRRRNYREGSVRSDRGGDEDESKRNRRQQRDKRDKYYYEGEERPRAGERSKTDSRRSQRQRGYENDSRYETEESTRFDARKESSRRSMRHSEAAERNRRGDRSDQGGEYEDYPRKGQGYRSSKRSGENYESDRRDRRRGGDDYDNTIERRRRSDKHRDRDPRYNDPRYDPREYEEYRKHSSRNARDSDMEKEGGGGGGPPRSGRMHHDGRHAAAMYGGYPGGGYYDPYTAYYYQQMARNNPQAYAEWYKKYYGQHAAAVTAGSTQAMPASADTSLTAAANDGRESVHSGRSSAHNDLKDRYTHAYITQANEYHRHYHHHQQQQQHHHQQLQQHHHHQHHLQQMAFNQTHNSTMLVDEDSLNQSTSLYSGIGGGGGLSQAHSQTNLSQIHGGYYVTPSVLQTAAAAGAHATPSLYYARSDYAESRSGAISVRHPDPIASEPQRLTPCKFINEHAVVSFGSGILVTVKPKYTPHGQISNIVKLLKFKPNDETRKLFKVFPGPLVRGLTHKKTVIEFCQEQIRLGPMETTIYAKQLISNNAEKYRASYTLMWNLLILLLKQNGMVVGTDIAELLLKNQQQFAYQPNNSMNNSVKSKSGSTSPVAEDNEAIKDDADIANNEESKEDKDQELRESSEEKMPSSSSNALSETEITEKFRNYLLYGNVNEALEWATDNNLWGHALFLASKLDRRSHANVMMKFANKLALNDPLQTLYQLMSGRSPSSVTCVQDEKWGDWRPHLSMILSNTSQKPELDRKAITTLGDSLFNRGDLYAAHFCYLMAQVGFGRYQESATQENTLQQHLPKLVLLGSSHYKQFQEFAHNEAIVMTEIYEYACSLNDDKFSIVEFQPYKFLLATRLLDYGFHLKSLMYLEQISVHIARDPTKYESSFINKVYEMADRLKYYDPVLEKTIDDQQQLGNEEGDNALNTSQQQLEEQKWLQSLRQMAQQYKIDYAVPANSAVDSQQQQVMDPSFGYQQQHIDQQFMEINKQFSELNLQYQDQQQQQPQPQQQPTFYNPDLMQQQPQQTQNSMLATDAQQQPLSLDPYQTQNEMPAMQANEQQQTLDANQSSTTAQTDVYHQQTAAYMQPDMTSYGQNYYDPTQQQQGLQNYNNEGGHMDATQTTDSGSYDYWAQQQQQVTTAQPYGLDENARPTISMPKSKTYDTDDESSGKKQQAIAGGQKSTTGSEGKIMQQQTAQKNKENKDNKNNAAGNQNSGWFGGIWNKFSLKPKNQMILPDDKNPSIVWDPEKKKWVNTDGDEQEEESFKPPPKMGDMMMMSQANLAPPQSQPQQNQMPSFMDPQQQQQQQYVPTSLPNSASSPNPMQQQQQQQTSTQSNVTATTNPNAPGPTKTPTLQSNMFKMQRNRTLKNAYVDVFNPSGAPVNKAAENVLAPALPPAAVPQSGFFIPGGSGSTAGGVSQDNNGYQQQQQPQDTPQFYNPNQYGTGTGY